jgi:hypothetical protein
VFTAALANAQKFVPNVQVGAGGEGVAGLLTAILGQNLAAQPATSPTQGAQQPQRR